MEVSRKSSWLLPLLGVILLAEALQGVQGEVEIEGPSETECRPYIEKALRELENVGAGDADVGQSNEDASRLDSFSIDEKQSDEERSSEKPEDEIETQEAQEKELSTSNEEADETEAKTDTSTESGEKEDTEQKSTDPRESSEQDSGETKGAKSPEDVSDHASAEQTDKSVENIDEETTLTEPAVESASVETAEATPSVEDTQEQTPTGEGASVESVETVQDEVSTETAEDSSHETKEAQSAEATAHQSDEQAPTPDEAGNDSSKHSGSDEDQKQETQPDEDSSRTEDQPASTVTTSNEDDKQTSASNETADEEPTNVEEDQQKNASSEVDTAEDTSQDDDNEKDEATEKKDDQSNTETEENEAGRSKRSAEESDEKESEQSTAEDGQTTSVESEETITKISAEVEVNKTEEKATEDKEDDSKEGDGKQGDSKEEDYKEGDSREGDSKEGDSKAESKEADSKEGDTVEGEVNDNKSEKESESPETKEDVSSREDAESTGSDNEVSSEDAPEEELIIEMDIPKDLRPRDHVEQLLKLDREATKTEEVVDRISEITLRELKRLYENAIKPLETLYKYRDLSNRHYGDAEIFSKPLILFMGPWSGGKSSIINYLLNVEYNDTALRTGAEPSPAYFNLLMHGEEEEVIDGTQLAADYTFSGLQKFGQGLEERLRGVKLPSKLLEKVNIVEIPGILEVRKQVSRVFPFNDACQWFIDRADIIFLVYDPSKLDVGPETEAILDQLKGREYQTRIVLNKADQVKPEELMRVQGALIWNISPLMSSPQPPVMYTTSLWSRPYEQWAPVRLLQAQERAFLRDLRSAVDRRIENKIASARRFAVRVRNHAKMVDCYLTTYYNHKSIFGNRKQVSDAIIEHPQDYHIYEGLSTLTNISRYDLPDPDVYKDFFRLNPLYEFQQLSATCTYFRGCPINKLDVAIAYDLPELVGKHKRLVETALAESSQDQTQGS